MNARRAKAILWSVWPALGVWAIPSAASSPPAASPIPSPVAAGPTAHWLAPNDPWPLLATLPPSVDAAVVLDRPGTRLWEDPAGAALRAALSGTGLFAQTQRAWQGLASALGYTGDEAAVALLGRRVLVAWDGLTRDDGTGAAGAAGRADTRWAVVAQIDAETARSLRATLNAAPRRTHLGRVIYSVDAGRTAMAVIDDGAQTRVVFAPNGASALLDSLLAPAPSGTAGLTGPAQAALGKAEPGWAAVAAVRLPDSDTPAAIELRTNRGAWGLRMAGPGEDPARPGVQPSEGAPVGVLGQIGGDALLAAAFSGGPRFDGASMDLRLRLGAAPDADEGPEDDAARSLLRPAGGSVVALFAAEPGTLGPGAKEPAGAAQSALVAQMISHACAQASYAETVDRLVSTMIGGSRPPEHRGAFPEAVRTHRIEDETRPGAWPGPDARVAWCFAADADPACGAVSMSFAPAGVDPSGLARKGREAWLRGRSDVDASMITAGHARPRDLVRLMSDGRDTPLSGLARAVERVDWTVRADAGLTRAEVLVRLAAPGPRLGAP